MDKQLTLFPAQAVSFSDDDGRLLFPFSDQSTWADWKICHCRFIYHEGGRVYFSPFPLRVAFSKGTGKLTSTTHISRDPFAPVFLPKGRGKPLQKRKGGKWSKRAKAKNRRKRLRGRIEKRLGYNASRPLLPPFQAELEAAIEVEYRLTIEENRAYFIEGKDYSFPQPRTKTGGSL